MTFEAVFAPITVTLVVAPIRKVLLDKWEYVKVRLAEDVAEYKTLVVLDVIFLGQLRSGVLILKAFPSVINVLMDLFMQSPRSLDWWDE